MKKMFVAMITVVLMLSACDAMPATVPAVQPFPQPATELITQSGKFINFQNVPGDQVGARVNQLEQYSRHLYQWYAKYGAGTWNYQAFEANVNRLVNQSMSPATNYGKPLSAGDGFSALQFRGNLIKNEVERLVRWAKVEEKWYLLPTSSLLSQLISVASVAVATMEFFIIPPMINPCLPETWQIGICGARPNPQQ